MSTDKEATKKESVDSAASKPDASGSIDKPPIWQRKNFRIGMLCAGIFVIGAAIGSGVTAHAIFRRVRGAFRDPEVMATRMLSHMDSEVDLTEDQEAKIKVLLVDGMTRIGNAVRTEFTEVHAKVREVLTEEQKVLFDENVKRMHRHGFGHPGHGDGCRH